jgi:hypothetical protein
MRIAAIGLLLTVSFVVGISESVAAPPEVVPSAKIETKRLSLPPELAPWVDWVLYDVPDVACPSLDGVRHCIWPGELAVTVKAKGASFAYRVFVDRETRIRLPGSKDFWPQRVQVDGGFGLVSKEFGEPVIMLPRGQHLIEGGFEWASTPEVLPVPQAVARVSLSILDEDVDFPRVEQGRLWLGKSGVGEEDSAETVRATIYRRFEDGVPLNVVTRVQLNISGRAREISLGKILLADTIPTKIESSLPVRLPPEGDVSVFVRPGTHEIFITAAIIKPLKTILVPAPTPNFYDAEEVWVWVPDEQARSVRIDGLNAVDPERTSLPADWRGHATYLVARENTMAIAETRRGMVEPSPNMIKLSRELWLDLDGEGYTVRDALSGEMHQGWRLNYGPTGTLGRVYDNEEGSDLFITASPQTSLSGVEIRRPGLNLSAELRLDDARAAIPMVGWDHDMQSLSADLKLPPGWTLVGGKGVDSMPGTWLESWTLFDFFFVLMVALTLGKLFHWGWGPVTLVALCLSHGHADAPEWIWIGLLVTLALVRVLPQGWIRRLFVLTRAGMLIALAVILAPYARDQIRHSLHPQVGQPETGYSRSVNDFKGMDQGFLEESEQAMPSAVMAEPMLEKSGEGYADDEYKEEYDRASAVVDSVVGGKMARKNSPQNSWASKSQSLQQVDPNAVVQTGPGLPTWTWSNWQLRWTGPVRKDHVVQLWLVSPTVNRFLAALRVILLVLLALLMLAPKDMYWSEAIRLKKGFWTRLLGMASVLLAMAFSPNMAQAQDQVQMQQNNVELPIGVTTPANMLEELKRRLIEETLCQGPCAVASRAKIEVNEDAFEMTAEVHAEKLTAWHLPGPSDPLRIDEVKVDGVVSLEIRRDESGLAMVRLKPGRHTVQVAGKLVNRNVVTLQFRDETRPQYIEFESNEWTVDGIGPDGVPDNSIQLTKRVEAGAQDAALSTDLPPWFAVERRLELGLPWRVRTIVSRIDDGRPQLVKVPLLADEKVISEDVRTEGNRALVDFGRGTSVVEFSSEIPSSAQVTLTATQTEPFTETWYVQCSRIWRCDFTGVPRLNDVTDGVYQPFWKPWPGETLKIAIGRPNGAPGQAVTVDSVEYNVTPGKRLLLAELKLSVRASAGGTHEVTLPEGAELQKVTVDGEVRTIRPIDRVVSLPIKPGNQVFLMTWQQPWERNVHEVAPAVKLSSAAVNSSTTIRLGEGRWLLWVHGPAWGPAILFWSHLAILLLMALLLGRISSIPVRTWEWLLLVIGLSQLPVAAGLPILFWFLLLSWRGRNTKVEWWKFDFAQLGTLLLTLGSLGVLYAAIHYNLLVDIDMQVRGANSSNGLLRWYVDHTGPELATPGIISVSDWVFKTAMLIWAFWLVSRLIKWARWGWGEFSRDGLWRNPPKAKRPKPRPAAAAAAAAALPGLPSPAAEPQSHRETTKIGVNPDEEEPPVGQIPKRRGHTTIPGAPISEVEFDEEPRTEEPPTEE